MSMQEFLNMGGFGFYIWTSYIIAIAIFIGLFVMVKLQRNKLIKQVRRLYRIESKEKQI